MYHYQVFLFLGLATIAYCQANANTTVSLFLDIFFRFNDSPSTTGYVVNANPTATTYVLNCADAACPSPSSLSVNYATVTAAPGSQEYNKVDDGTTYYESCTFTGSTEATCYQSRTTTSGPTTEEYNVNVTYVPVPPASRGQQNIFGFPGLSQVLITSGADKLAAASTATATATSPNAVASMSGSTPSRVSQSAAATESAKNHAGSTRRATRLWYSFVALVVLGLVI